MSSFAVPKTALSVRRRRSRVIVLVVLAAVLVAVGLTAYVGRQALAARTSLEQAQDQLQVFRSALGKTDQDLPELYAPLQASATDAASRTSGPVWSLYEHLWWVGPI